MQVCHYGALIRMELEKSLEKYERTMVAFGNGVGAWASSSKVMTGMNWQMAGLKSKAIGTTASAE